MNSTQIDVEALVVRLSRSMGAMTRSAAIRRLYQRVTRAAGTEVERPSYLVLKQLVVDGPARITDLAQHHGVEPSTLSRHVTALAAVGLVEKRADPEDRRAALAAATATGSALVEQVERERHRILAAVLADWDPDDADRFVDLIERFNTDVTDLLNES